MFRARAALLVLSAWVASACHHREEATCTQARDLFLAQFESRAQKIAPGAPPELGQQLRADTARDIVLIKSRFVAECLKTPNMDLSCFQDGPGATSPTCRQLVRDLGTRVLAH